MSRAKRYLFLTHRWTGIVLCLFMAMWFVSGVVMMYVGYPKLTAVERLERLPELDLAGCCVPLERVLERVAAVPPREVRLATARNEPAYLVIDARGVHHAFAARDGTAFLPTDEEFALAAARQFAPDQTVVWLERVKEDAWTHSRALDPHRPLHRVRIDDAAGTDVYVSARTGEVVRDATASERAWNWAGAWIHWLYPFRGGTLDRYWSDIVVWLSVAGTLLALSGTIVGILRWRFRGRYKRGTRSPYANAMMRWHHVAGLVFATVTITWIASGLLSMGAPWTPFEYAGPRPDVRAVAGGPLDASKYERGPAGALRALGAGFAARELVWLRFEGRPYYLALDGAGRTRLVPGAAGEASFEQFPRAAIERAARLALPSASIVGFEWLDAYDAYYYARAPHTMHGHGERRLPMLRAKFDDPGRTWIHLDPHTGQVQSTLDTTRRVKRWLFAFLHSFDWLPLLHARPLWDLLLIVLSAGGAAVCLTGVVIGWRRLT